VGIVRGERDERALRPERAIGSFGAEAGAREPRDHADGAGDREITLSRIVRSTRDEHRADDLRHDESTFDGHVTAPAIAKLASGDRTDVAVRVRVREESEAHFAAHFPFRQT
jgi:hypothetical protein